MINDLNYDKYDLVVQNGGSTYMELRMVHQLKLSSAQQGIKDPYCKLINQFLNIKL